MATTHVAVDAAGPDAFHLSSLNKALDVLEAFTPQDREWSLGDLSARLGLAKPTLRRVLQNLVARGWVRQDDATRRYGLGLKCWEVGMAAVGGGLSETAGPFLRRAAEATGEQATLWVYDRGDAVCIDRAEASHRVRSFTRLGTREPAHLLAGGCCLLADEDEVEIARVLAASDDPGGVARRLDDVRRLGYVVSRGARWHDVFAVAAPLRDRSDTTVAAVSVSGPSARFGEEAIDRIAGAVRAAAAGASVQLGSRAGRRAPASPGRPGADRGPAVDETEIAPELAPASSATAGAANGH